MSTKICNPWTSFNEALHAYEEALKSHHYSQSSVTFHMSVLTKIYNDVSNESHSYSLPKAEQWLSKQMERVSSGRIVRHTYECMRIVISRFDHFYREGTLVIKRRNERRKNLPDCFYSIHQEFLHTLPQNLAPGTLSLHNTNSRRFFEYLANRSITDLRSVDNETVRNYFIEAAVQHKRSMEKVLQALKLLFPFLYKKGYENFGYDFSIIKPGYKRKQMLPCFTYDDVKSILSLIDRSTTIGRRDYAIILIAVFTGLRITDITDLRLTDVDWRKREITVKQKKTKNELCLPFNIETGNALADYILNGRPPSAEEYIFLNNVPPFTKIIGDGVGYHILKRCYGHNDELSAKYSDKTFHSFRRSLASWLSAEQTPLPLISEILGHAVLSAAKPYLSYDASRMAMCCLGLDDIPVLKEELI